MKDDNLGYNVKCYSELEEIYSITDEWRNLVFNSYANWIYSLPEWCLSWYKALGRAGSLRIIIVKDKDETLVGLAPLWKGPGSLSELKVKKGEFISGDQADYHDLIIQEGKEESIVPVLLDGITQFIGKVNILEFKHIPHDSPNLALIRRYLEAKKTRTFEKQDISPYCLFAPTYNEMENSWHSSHIGDIRRQKKRLNKLGKLELKIYADEKEILNDIEDFFNMHTDKWKSDGYPAMFLNLDNQIFYKEIVRSIGVKGGVHFSKLMIDDIPISYHFGFVHNNRFYWYKPAFKKEYKNYSPGKIHISMLMEVLAQQNLRIFDFLIGDEAYKYQWDVKELFCKTIVVQKYGLKGFIGYEWLRWGRDMVKNSVNEKYLRKIIALYIEGRKINK